VLLTKHHAMKVYWEWRYGSTHAWHWYWWRWVVHFMLQPLYPQGKSSWYPSDRRLGGPQSQSGHGGEEKNSQPLPRLEPLIIQPVTQCYTTSGWNLCCSWNVYVIMRMSPVLNTLNSTTLSWFTNIMLILSSS
jgi:hypothetical protein